MVVDGGGSKRNALLGDMLAEKAAENGWAGLVIYGCIRDLNETGKIHLGVQALGTIPRKTEKRGIGDLNIPVTYHGMALHPGQSVYDDNNVTTLSEKLRVAAR